MVKEEEVVLAMMEEMMTMLTMMAVTTIDEMRMKKGRQPALAPYMINANESVKSMHFSVAWQRSGR